MNKRQAVSLLGAASILAGCAAPGSPPGTPAIAPIVQRTSSNGVPCSPIQSTSNTTNAVIGGAGGAAAGAAIAGISGAHSRGVRNSALAGAVIGAVGGSQYNNAIGAKELDDGSIKLNIPGAVLFNTGKSDINPSFIPTLTKVAATVRDYCGVTARIVGFTDSTGTYAANKVLSEQRAQAVVTYMLTQQIGQDRLFSEGHSSDEAVGDNKTEAGRAQNRRVEIYIRPPT